MSFPSRTIALPAAEPRSRWSNLRPIGAIARARVVRFLLSLVSGAGPNDRPGASVLRELGLGGEEDGHAFDFADIHPGIEASRIRFLQTGQAWRGS